MYTCRADDPSQGSMDYGDFHALTSLDMVRYFSSNDGRIDPTSFVAIYCLNPPKDDDCPVGICPNPDVAGPLLRIARKFSFSSLQRMVI
jgi:hypothetical protein